MSALQQFFDAERTRRGWSMRETAKRSQISLSKAYAIVNGDDNVEFETFENIAAAFAMSPAELAVAIGKGAAGDDPAHAQVVALFRAVPIEKRLAAIDMLRGLAVQPTNKGPNPRGLVNGRKADSDMGRPGRGRTLKPHTSSGDDSAEQGRVPSYHRSLKTQLLNAMTAFGRLLQPSNALRAELAR